MVAIAALPLSSLILGPLERYYPPNPDISAASGLLILGGGERPAEAKAWGTPEVNEGGERFLAALWLAEQHQNLPVVFTGGSNRVLGTRRAETAYAEKIFGKAGLDLERLTIETTSRNTWENAVNTRRILGSERVAQPWVLVTSAYHMRRSVETFCAAGWGSIIPFPVDYGTYEGEPMLEWELTENLLRLNKAVKEWIGILAYRYMERADKEAGCLHE